MEPPAPSARLAGRRALVTLADRYTGPAVAERFRAEGATVVADTGRYSEANEPGEVVAAAGRIDILVVNLIAKVTLAPAMDTTDEQWTTTFDTLVQVIPFAGGWVTSS